MSSAGKIWNDVIAEADLPRGGRCDEEDAAGFTLLEMMVVLVLVGLMAAMAVPRLSGSYEKLPLVTAARDLAAIMRFARSQAVSRSCSMAVWFQPEDRRIFVAVPKAPEGDAAAESKEIDDGVERIYHLPVNLTLACEPGPEEALETDIDIITFFPIGNCTGADIRLSDAMGRSRRVEVDSITGAVSLGE
ncbi:MAG: pilus assembly FimT family protein [Thermodesulfobacteriota bacterium]